MIYNCKLIASMMIYEQKLGSRWGDIASQYDEYRLSPPEELIQWIHSYTGNGEHVNLVADLGCGTGKSTRPWNSFAKNVIGIDPSEKLLNVANNNNTYTNVSFKMGFGAETGLPDNSVDIVTAMHSIHWMEPNSTLVEILRMLKNGGIFAMYGHELAPTSQYLEVEKEIFILKSKIRNLAIYHELESNIMHLNIMDFGKFTEEKKCFEYSRYFNFSNIITWTANDYLGWIYTLGNVQKLLSDFKISEEELGLNQFEKTLKKCFKNDANELLINWKIYLFKNKII
jgi:ubiquinone/menaquinone biosynthesis C-methylase UbiE